MRDVEWVTHLKTSEKRRKVVKTVIKTSRKEAPRCKTVIKPTTGA